MGRRTVHILRDTGVTMETSTVDLALRILAIVDNTRSDYVWTLAQGADIGVPLARGIIRGHVTGVSEDGIAVLHETLDTLTDAMALNRP